MGSACSAPTKSGDMTSERRPSTIRASFNSVRMNKASLMKPGAEYGQLYSIGDPLGPDELVLAVVKNENEVEYVSRALEKKEMPIQDTNALQDHLSILASLEHLHIARFLEAFDNGERVQMIYEKAKPQSIFEEEDTLRSCKPLNQETTQMYCRQIASALRVAHKCGVVHGRLCDSSLLVSPSLDQEEDKAVKICDFGQTFVTRPARKKSRHEWECPELAWEELNPPNNLTVFRSNIKAYQSTDMWSLGILLYRMLTGKMPFAGKSQSDVKDAIKSKAVEFGKEWDKMPDAREVVHGLLKNAWRIRLTADRVLKHPWIVLSKARMRKGRMMRVLQNVMLNTSESTFKKFTLRVIAEEMTAEKIEIIQKAFSILDKNGDGTLELEEIRAALKKYGEEEAVADEIFEAIDRDASGTLNFAEFTAVSLGLAEYSEREVLWYAFTRFDRDCSGKFDKEEICRVLKEVEHTSEGAALEAEVDEIAKDIEMPMDFHSFVQYMVTPAGEPVSKMKSAWNRFCQDVIKADVHGIKHLQPKSMDSETAKASALFKPVYRSTHFGSPSNGEMAAGKRKSVKAPS